MCCYNLHYLSYTLSSKQCEIPDKTHIRHSWCTLLLTRRTTDTQVHTILVPLWHILIYQNTMHYYSIFLFSIMYVLHEWSTKQRLDDATMNRNFIVKQNTLITFRIREIENANSVRCTQLARKVCSLCSVWCLNWMGLSDVSMVWARKVHQESTL